MSLTNIEVSVTRETFEHPETLKLVIKKRLDRFDFEQIAAEFAEKCEELETSEQVAEISKEFVFLRIVDTKITITTQVGNIYGPDFYSILINIDGRIWSIHTPWNAKLQANMAMKIIKKELNENLDHHKEAIEGLISAFEDFAADTFPKNEFTGKGVKIRGANC